MQIIYDANNINKNYLNAYVQFYYDGKRLHLYNTIYNKEVVLSGSEKILQQLIRLLMQGVDDKKLIDILKKISKNPDSLYEYLLQNFIIE